MKTEDLKEEKEVTTALEVAGFINIEHQIDSEQFCFRDEIEWWDTQWSICHRAFMERLDPDSLREYKREMLDIVRIISPVKVFQQPSLLDIRAQRNQQIKKRNDEAAQQIRLDL